MGTSLKTEIGVIFNGTRLKARQGSSVEEFLRARGLTPERQVVELNGAAMSYAVFARRPLEEGDRMEVFNIVAGG